MNDNIQSALNQSPVPQAGNPPGNATATETVAWSSIVSGAQLTAKGRPLHFVSPVSIN